MQKRHHTVPRCYLENFTDENGHAWVLDRKNKIFNTTPENILVETHFYRITLMDGTKSVVVENTLANIEGAYADIFNRKLSKDEFLTPEERAKVSIFFAGMLHRTKPQRESMRNMLERMRGSMEEWRKQFETLTPEARRRSSAMHSSGEGTSITIDELDAGIEDFDEHHTAGLIGQITNTAQIIFNMKWSIWKHPDDEGAFVTSDDPLVIRRPEAEKKYGRNAFGSRPGLMFKDAEITLPLSKNRLLLAGWILNEYSYCTPPSDMAQGMNQRTILHSSERIIASSRKQLEGIMAKYPPNPKKE